MGLGKLKIIGKITPKLIFKQQSQCSLVWVDCSENTFKMSIQLIMYEKVGWKENINLNIFFLGLAWHMLSPKQPYFYTKLSGGFFYS